MGLIHCLLSYIAASVYRLARQFHNIRHWGRMFKMIIPLEDRERLYSTTFIPILMPKVTSTKWQALLCFLPSQPGILGWEDKMFTSKNRLCKAPRPPSPPFSLPTPNRNSKREPTGTCSMELAALLSWEVFLSWKRWNKKVQKRHITTECLRPFFSLPSLSLKHILTPHSLQDTPSWLSLYQLSWPASRASFQGHSHQSNKCDLSSDSA